MPRILTFKKPLVALLAAVALTAASAQDAASTWTDKDSRLANQYIALLQQDPAYGQPVDLLWDLYQKNNATPLLLEHFAAQSANPVALLVYGHLLRKSGDLPAAMVAYDDALKAVPDSRQALDAKTDLAVALDDIPTALETLDRITALLPATGPETAAHHLRIATFHANNSAPESAAAALDSAVSASPDDPALRKRVADSYLGIGDLPGAIAQFQHLATNSADPATKVNALAELARLHELAGDLTEATAALEQGMAATHFKHHLHHEFFRRLVRLNERENNLPALAEKLATAADATPPSEPALLAAATFAKLTVDPVATLTWLEKLHTAFPDDPVYHLDYATALVENDRLEDAAASLDALIAKSPPRSQPLSLTLARCEVDTKLGQRTEASARLAEALARHRGDRTSESTILDFATTHFIDSVALEVLGSRAQRAPSDPEHAFALARFHLERGHPENAREAVLAFVEAGNPAPARLAARLRQAADFLVSRDQPDAAQTFAARAAEIGSDDPASLLQLAEIAFARTDIPLAVSRLEEALAKSPDPAERIALDSRILSYLQHNFHKQVLDADDSAFRIGSFIAPPTSAATRPEENDRTTSYAKATLDYAADRAADAQADPTFDNTFRATWWAFRTDDFAAAYRSLRQLFKLRPEPDLHTAKLALEIAASSGVYALARRQLLLLTQLDPENALSHIVRLAELELSSSPIEVNPGLGTSIPSNRPARAIALLQPLVESGDLDIKVVESLARAHAADGHPELAFQLWQDCFENAPDPATRANLLGPLAAEFLTRNFTDKAIDAYSRVIREHRDDKKRRELFAQQLSLASGNAATAVLGQLVATYRSLQAGDPLEPFWNEALARTLARSGETADAFAAMKRAYYNDPDPDPGVLTELREMALELGDRPAALYFQRQLIYSSGDGAGPAEWQKLVSMLEERLDVDATDRARERLERRFGQDPDLLTGLLEHYQKSGQDAAALRVASQLAELRPWDPAAQYRLGLLQRDAGQTREAFDALSAAIQQSPTDDAYNPGETPVVEIHHAAVLASTVRTDPFLTESESHRTLTLLGKIAGSAKIETVPTDPTQLQLAAVSAAAPLARDLGGDTLNSWQTSWQSSAAGSPHAAYRALAGSGAGSPAITIARDHLLSLETEESYLRYAYALVTLHRWDELAAWISAPDALTTSHAKRQRIASFVIAGMLRTSGPESPTADDILSLASTGRFGSPDFWSFALAAASGRDYRKALAIANAGSTPPDPSRAYSLSVWSHWAGDLDTSHDLLLSSFDSPLDDPSHPNWFYTAFTELRNQTSDPADLQHITRNAVSIANAHASTLSGSRRRGTAGGFIQPQDLVRRIAGLPAPTAQVPSPATYFNQLQFWSDAASTTSLFQSHRLGEVAASTSAAVLDAAASPPLADDDNYGYYLTFSANALTAQLRHASLPEQQSLVARALASDLSPEETFDLATVLATRGFPRHSATAHLQLVHQNPTDNQFVTAFIRACEDALDPAPALAYFNRVLVARDLQPPQRTPLAFLSNNYAKFLRMAGDADSLALFAETAPETPASPSEPTARELPYILAIAGLHTDTGNHAAAIPHFRAALEIDPDSTAVIAFLAAALIETGDLAAALELLDSPPARQSILPADRGRILTARANTLEKLGRPDDILPVLVDALELALAAPLIEVATTAAGAGHLTEATSALELARRASTDPADRLAYATTALTLTLSSGETSPSTLAARLAPVLEAPSPTAEDLAALTATLHTHATHLTPAWQHLAAAGTLRHTRTNAPLAALAHLAISATLDPPTLAAADTPAPIVTTAARHLLDTGRPTGARQLLTTFIAAAPTPAKTAPAQVAVAAALGDDITLRTLLANALRGADRTTRSDVALPAAFAAAGMNTRAISLYHAQWTDILDTAEITLRQTYDNPSRRASFLDRFDATFIGYARLLIAENRFAEAAELVPYAVGLSPASAATVTSELHVALATPPEKFLAATAPLGLTAGIARAAALLHAKTLHSEIPAPTAP